MNELVYLFLIVAGSPVAHIGTYSQMEACRAAVARAWTPKGPAADQTWGFLCIHASDKAIPPPKD